MLSSEQRGILKGMLLGAILPASPILSGAWLIQVPRSPEAAGHLVWIVPFVVILALPLAAIIAAIARHRFFHAAVIDGGNDPADRWLMAARAVLQNTLEQTVLATLVFLALAILLPPAWLGILPAAALWFLLGRAIFAFTYVRGAAARSFGFASTFYPTLAGLFAAVLLLALR
jgi:hypothetical protein